MQFKLFHNELDCPFNYDTDESFAKVYLWHAERFVSLGDRKRDEETLAFFTKNAPQNIGKDIDILLRAYIFSCCEHISSRGSNDDNFNSIISSAVNIYRKFIAVYEKIDDNIEPHYTFENITSVNQYDIIASSIVEDLCRKLPKDKFKVVSSHILSDSPIITVWKCKGIKRFPYYKLTSPFVMIILLTSNDCKKNYIVDFSRSIGPISPAFEIVEYNMKKHEWRIVLGSGEIFYTSVSGFLGIDFKDYLKQ